MMTQKVLGVIGVLATVQAVASVDITGGVLTFDVQSGSETYSSAIPSDVTKVIKTGDGTGVLSVASPDFKGDTEIRGGVLQVKAVGVIGNDGKLTVAAGAQLRVSFADKMVATTTYFNCDTEIAGAGPDGNGAIDVRDGSGGGNGDKLFKSIKLTDGAAVGGNMRWGCKAWDLNSCTLTNVTANQFVFYGATVSNPGHFIHNGPNNVTFITSASTLAGDSSNVFKPVNDKAMLSFWQCNATLVPWTLDLRDYLGTEFAYKAYGTSVNDRKAVWTGPVLLGSKTLRFAPGTSSNFITAYPNVAGSITGDGGTVDQVDPMTTTLSGETHDFLALNPTRGILTVTNGSHHTYGRFLEDSLTGNNKNYRNRTLRFVDAAAVTVTNSNKETYTVHVRSSLADGDLPSRLEILGATAVTNVNKLLFYAGFKTNRWGIVKVADGASVTNVNLLTGIDSGKGALYVKDASFHSNAGPGYDGRIAALGSEIGALGDSYGYWGMSNSTVLVDGYTTVAMSEGTTGFLVQHGGLHRYNGNTMRLGHGGFAHYRIDAGGLFDHSAASFALGSYYSGWGKHSVGGTTIFTVADGADAFVYELTAFARTNGMSQLNLNTSGCLRFDSARGRVACSTVARAEGATFHLSFDGGVFRQTYNGKTFYFDASGNYDGRPTQIVVHDGGALIDVDNAERTAYWNAPLTAPTGKVIQSIALPTDAEFLASTNIGPARIEIVGAGTGASAFVAFDDAAEKLDRVVLDSPGTGYGDATTATVVSPITGKRYACAVTLADAVGGGLVKLGPGTLRLETANTYAGSTIVSNGTLISVADASVPANRNLAVEAGATFDAHTNNLSIATLSGAGVLQAGQKTTLSAVSYKPHFVDAQTNGCLNVLAKNFTLGAVDGADLDFEHLDPSMRHTLCTFTTPLAETPTFENFPATWTVRLSADGRRVTTWYKKGLMILVH